MNAEMPHIFDHVFEHFRVVNSDNSSIADDFVECAQWLESPGCLFQRSNFVLGSEVRTEGVIKPGLFLSVVLKGAGGGGPLKGTQRFSYTNNSISVLALKEPTPWEGDAPSGAQMQAAGVAFPISSLERIGLRDEFLELFADDRTVFVTSWKASPRIQAIAMEMISPTAEGKAGELLLAAQATEILARAMAALRGGSDIVAFIDPKRLRLQAVKELMESDLRHPWTIAELARQAGLSRRSFNAQFHRLCGVSASEYLRISRLVFAREALLHQGLTVTEAAYAAGYANPANFSTAFRRHFGCVPSSCLRDKSS